MGAAIRGFGARRGFLPGEAWRHPAADRLDGPVGKRISDSAQLAVEHINQGGGIKGCPVQFILRDDQGQPAVGVDAAKYLIDVERVSALTGTVSSGVSLPILLSVVAPAKIPMVSCCSTAATFTTLAQEGKTGGFFFRTLPTVKTQAYVSALIAQERGYQAHRGHLHQHRFRHRDGQGLHALRWRNRARRSSLPSPTTTTSPPIAPRSCGARREA